MGLYKLIQNSLFVSEYQWDDQPIHQRAEFCNVCFAGYLADWPWIQAMNRMRMGDITKISPTEHRDFTNDNDDDVANENADIPSISSLKIMILACSFGTFWRSERVF